MKKIFSLIMAGAMSISIVGTAFAEMQIGKTIPEVYVNDREIAFQDQTPIIDVSVNRTMIPLRGVFEAMGASVRWDGEARTVTIDSYDNLTRLVLEIGNPVMKVYTAVTLLKYDEAEFELDAAPVIINNRTLVPLRAIGENMAADVEWDGETHTVTIHSKEYKKFLAKKTEEAKTADENLGEDYTYSLKDNLLNLSLSADKEEVEAEEEVVINVNMSNVGTAGEVGLRGVTATVYYDSEKFEFVSGNMLINGEKPESLGANNPEFMNDSVKVVEIVMPQKDAELIKAEDSVVYSLTFKSINGEAGEFSLSDRKTHIGYDTSIMLGTAEDNKMYQNYKELYIDTTPVVVK